MGTIIGAVFPVSEEHARRIFDEKRNIFAKYTKMICLSKKSKIVFYVTGGGGIIGEGTVENTEKLEPELAWKTYRERLFLDLNEYEQYTLLSPISKRTRTSPQITIFVLNQIKKYKQSSRPNFSVTPSGKYLTREEYLEVTRTKP